MPTVKPEVGMGATRFMGSDRHAYTVIEVKSPKIIVVQRDTATRTDKNGMSDVQTYDFQPRSDGLTWTLTLRKDGQWKRINSNEAFGIGYRREHFDFGF